MLRAALVWLSVMLCPLSAGSQELRLSVEDTRQLVFVLLGQNQPSAAAHAARAVLEARPGDIPALLGLSQAALALGQSTAAADAGQRAWQNAKSLRDRFASAMVTARALAADERKLQAQLWLRRAYQAAPDAQAKRAAARDIRRLRQLTPLLIQLSFGIEPSSNINGGARSERVEGGTISGTSLALSGIEFNTSAQLRYTVPSQGNSRHSLTARGTWRQFTLSSQARAIAPAASGSDFAFGEVELGWEGRHRRGKGQLTHRLNLGHSRSGGAALSRFVGGALGWSQPLGGTQHGGGRLSFTYQLERQDRLDSPIRSSTLNALSAQWDFRSEAGQWAISGRVARLASESAIIGHDAASLTARFTPRKPWIGTQTRLAAQYEHRSYAQPIIFGLRRDNTLELSVDITFGKIDYYGFAPTLDLTARRTQSSIDLYDAQTLSVGLGLTSLF